MIRITSPRYVKRRQHTAARFTKAIESGLTLAMREVLGNDARRIQKRELGVHEWHAMFSPVFGILGRIPREAWAHCREYSGRMGLEPYLYMVRSGL
jgi:hypothetical protein